MAQERDRRAISLPYACPLPYPPHCTNHTHTPPCVSQECFFFGNQSHYYIITFGKQSYFAFKCVDTQQHIVVVGETVVVVVVVEISVVVVVVEEEVGYGDLIPGTVSGKLVAAVTMYLGVLA